MAAWGVSELLQRQMLLVLQGANWQRSGGKGQKPKAIELPPERRGRPVKPQGSEIARKLMNLGLIPPGGGHLADRAGVP